VSQTKSPAAPPAKLAAKAPARAAANADLTPGKPEGYTPKGKVTVLAEAVNVRVVSDDVRVWKELVE
jgi:hypothetical protein